MKIYMKTFEDNEPVSRGKYFPHKLVMKHIKTTAEEMHKFAYTNPAGKGLRYKITNDPIHLKDTLETSFRHTGGSLVKANNNNQPVEVLTFNVYLVNKAEGLRELVWNREIRINSKDWVYYRAMTNKDTNFKRSLPSVVWGVK